LRGGGGPAPENGHTAPYTSRARCDLEGPFKGGWGGPGPPAQELLASICWEPSNTPWVGGFFKAAVGLGASTTIGTRTRS
jgi:hypothetical protein